MGWRDLKSLNRLLVGKGDLALRDGSRGMRPPHMPWQSIVLSQGPACRDLGWSPPHVTILIGRAPLGAPSRSPVYAHSAPASDETVRPSVPSRSSRRRW